MGGGGRETHFVCGCGIRAWLCQRLNSGGKRKHCSVEAVYRNLISILSLLIQLCANGKFLQPQNFSEAADTSRVLLKYFLIYIEINIASFSLCGSREAGTVARHSKRRVSISTIMTFFFTI